MLKVLLVDDEPFIIQGLKVLIDWEQEGYMIAGTASNGKEAYDFLKKESVDLIIADIQMPVMTGLASAGSDTKRKSIECIFCHIKRICGFRVCKKGASN